MNLPSDLHPFAELVARRIPTEDAATRRFVLTEGWLQGRTSFGGVISALGVQAMRDVAGSGWDSSVSLRALQTSFVAPVGAGPVDVRVQVLREGKNVRQVQAHVLQEGQVAAVLLAVFAADRASVLPTHLPQRPAPTHAPEDVLPRKLRPGMGPRFLEQFDVRWDSGPIPYSGQAGYATRVHMRLAHPGDRGSVPTELQAVLLADVSPTPAAGHYTQPTPASSVSWSLELRPLSSVPEEDGWWRADNESIAVAGGYVNHVARLWAPSGELAAVGAQVVALFG